MEVAKQDITKLVAAGWVPPTPINVKARDGKTDLYGLMFKPTNFDASKKYPIVNNVYPGPQTGSCGGREFMAAHATCSRSLSWDSSSSASTAWARPSAPRAFHEFYYGNLGDNTIPDQVAGMKELAAQVSMDRHRRVGMYGHSGGGNATAAAMFHYPDFFKVGIAESGNHDERDYEDDWAEKWAGLEVKNPDGTSNYDSQANQNYRQKPERPSAAGPRNDGQQRSAQQHAARSRCPDQGQQGLRSADDPQRCPRLRRGLAST